MHAGSVSAITKRLRYVSYMYCASNLPNVVDLEERCMLLHADANTCMFFSDYNVQLDMPIACTVAIIIIIFF